MEIHVHFYSYCKDITKCPGIIESMPDGSRISDLLGKIFARFPELAKLSSSLLIAVGVDYQARDYVLKDGDEVSLFPPVQGG